MKKDSKQDSKRAIPASPGASSQRPQPGAAAQTRGADGQALAEGSHPKKGQIGEGSYEATRDYQKNIKSYLDKADVTSDAKAARPATPEEAADLKKAEQEGLSHSKSPGQ